jgi:hypothetical protein
VRDDDDDVGAVLGREPVPKSRSSPRVLYDFSVAGLTGGRLPAQQHETRGRAVRNNEEREMKKEESRETWI